MNLAGRDLDLWLSVTDHSVKLYSATQLFSMMYFFLSFHFFSFSSMKKQRLKLFVSSNFLSFSTLCISRKYTDKRRSDMSFRVLFGLFSKIRLYEARWIKVSRRWIRSRFLSEYHPEKVRAAFWMTVSSSNTVLFPTSLQMFSDLLLFDSRTFSPKCFPGLQVCCSLGKAAFI